MIDMKVPWDEVQFHWSESAWCLSKSFDDMIMSLLVGILLIIFSVTMRIRSHKDVNVRLAGIYHSDRQPSSPQ